MGRFGLLLAGFLGGIAVSAAVGMWIVFPWVWGEAHSGSTEVWRVENQLTLQSGTIISPGTDLTVSDYMPEGFVRLNLSINVEGDALERFEKRTEEYPNLKIPYWVEQ